MEMREPEQRSPECRLGLPACLPAATRKQKDHSSLSIASFFMTWLNKLPGQAAPIRVTLFYFLHKIAIP